MTKEEMTAKGLELVSYAGEARSEYLMAIKFAKEGKWDKVDASIEAGGEALIEAHKTQTELLHAEAQGNYSDVTMIMVHGQDHLMTTVLLRDLVMTLIDIYKK